MNIFVHFLKTPYINNGKSSFILAYNVDLFNKNNINKKNLQKNIYL